MADKDFIVKNGFIVNTDLIVADGDTNRVGINTLSPDATLTVSGTSNVSGNTTVGGTIATGNSTVTGFINVSSTANVGGVASFRSNVVANGQLIVSNVVSTGNATVTGFINVSSSANIAGVVNVGGNSTFRSNTSVNGQFSVTNTVAFGNTTITGFVDASLYANIAGTSNVGGVASFRANVVANGQLIVANIISTGNATVTGFINVSSTANIAGAANVGGTLSVVGNSTFGNTSSGNATVTGFINVSSTANVGGVASFRANVVANGQLIVANVVSTGNATVTGFINVTSSANIAGAANVGGTLSVVGSSTLGSVSSGNTTITGFINVSSSANIAGLTTFLANVNMKGAANVDGTLRVGGDLVITGNVSYTGVSTSDIIPPSNSFSIGNNTNRWAVWAFTVNTSGDATVGGNLFVNATTITIGNLSSNATVNTTVYSGTANNATNLGGQSASFYRNADNINAGTLNNARLNSSNTTQAGIVQLNDTVISTSIVLAATANSVKNAYDRAIDANTRAESAQSAAVSAYSNAIAFSANATNLTSGTVNNARLNTANTTQAGIVQLVDSVASTNTTAASTPSSVKLAYDTAISANARAASAQTQAESAYSNAVFSFAPKESPTFTGTVTVGNVVSSGNLSLSSASALLIGNVSVNVFTNSSLIRISNSTSTANLLPTSLVIGTSTVNSTAIAAGANVFSNVTAVTVGNTIVRSINLVLGGQLTANSLTGSAGQVLASGGAGNVYWTTLPADITSVNAGNGLSGGGTTGDITLDVRANNGIVSNTTGVFVLQGTGTVVNSTGVHVNASYIGTLTSNNTSFVGSTSAANVVSNTQLQSNLANYATTTNLSQNLANYVTTTNLSQNLANYQTTSGLSANVATLTSNNTLFLGGVAAANYSRLNVVESRTANLKFNDNVEVQLGTDNDFRMYHDSINLIMENKLGSFTYYTPSTGSGFIWHVGTVGNNVVGSLTNLGNFWVTGDITAYYSSDINLKENIKPIDNALEKLKTIDGVTYDWKDEYLAKQTSPYSRKQDIGVIAQQIETIMPEIVVTRDDGTKAVKYERIVALLIEAVKELSTEVEKLKKE